MHAMRGVGFRLELVASLDLERDVSARDRDRNASADIPMVVDLVSIANAKGTLASILAIGSADPFLARCQDRERRNSHSSGGACISSAFHLTNLAVQASDLLVDASDLLVEPLLRVVELATVNCLGAARRNRPVRNIVQRNRTSVTRGSIAEGNVRAIGRDRADFLVGQRGVIGIDEAGVRLDSALERNVGSCLSGIGRDLGCVGRGLSGIHNSLGGFVARDRVRVGGDLTLQVGIGRGLSGIHDSLGSFVAADGVRVGGDSALERGVLRRLGCVGYCLGVVDRKLGAVDCSLGNGRPTACAAARERAHGAGSRNRNLLRRGNGRASFARRKASNARGNRRSDGANARLLGRSDGCARLTSRETRQARAGREHYGLSHRGGCRECNEGC